MKICEGFISFIDRFMSGYFQEVWEIYGVRIFLCWWCVVMSENFIVYENQNFKKVFFEWEFL